MLNIDEDFFHFLRNIPWQEVWVTWVFLLLGATMHWLKKVTTNEASLNLLRYCFTDSPGRTVLTAITLLGAEVTLVTTGTAQGMTWPSLMYTAFVTGFSANSLTNKGSDPVKSNPPVDGEPKP